MTSTAPLFDKPAETSQAPSQTLVPAGAFLLVADPHELAFARMAAELCDSGAPAPGPLGRFSKLARRAAGALKIDGPNRARDWMSAFASASDMLESFGEIGPSKGAIPVELHSHGFLSLARELKDLLTLLPALQRSFKTQSISTTTKAGEKKNILIRAKQAIPDGATVASTFHAIAKFAGPAYFDSPYGPGTDRILIGTGNHNMIEAHLSYTGERIQEALGEPLNTAVAGKAFALLHESFHLSQAWQAQREGTLANAMLPELLRQSPQLVAQSKELWNFKLEADTHEAERWAFKTLQESYCDIMAASAFGKKDPQRVSAVASGIEQWRLKFKEIAKKAKPGLGARLLKKLSKKNESDPHHTAQALGAFRELLDSGALSSEDNAQRWSEAAKLAAYAGLLRLCAERMEQFPKSPAPQSGKESVEWQRKLQEFGLATKTARALLGARPNGLDRSFSSMLPEASVEALSRVVKLEAEEALRDFRPQAPAIDFSKRPGAATPPMPPKDTGPV